MGVIVYNGVSSQDLGVVIEHPPVYQTPSRDFNVIHIPGRNGDLLIDKKSFSNGKLTYEIAFGEVDGDFYQMAADVMSWLYSSNKYTRLEDSYESDIYREAIFRESASITNLLNQAGRATINFDCKPQKFLKSGDIPLQLSNTDYIYNPTVFDAKPIIEIQSNSPYGGIPDGWIQVNNRVVSWRSISSHVLVIDCEKQDVYDKNTLFNYNSNITMQFGFPILNPGNNQVSCGDSGNRKVLIYPRWWRL